MDDNSTHIKNRRTIVALILTCGVSCAPPPQQPSAPVAQENNTARYSEFNQTQPTDSASTSENNEYSLVDQVRDIPWRIDPIHLPPRIPDLATQEQTLASINNPVQRAKPRYQLAQLYSKIARDVKSVAKSRQASEFSINHIITAQKEAPTAAFLDEALYLLALEYERVGALNESNTILQQLLQQYPLSKFVSVAQVSLGELSLKQANNNPELLNAAKLHFEESIKVPLTENPLHGFALYRLAQIGQKQNDGRAKHSYTVKLNSYLQNNPESGISRRLKELMVHAPLSLD